MSRSNEYNGGLTREQFLFYEMRIVAKLINSGDSRESIKKNVIENNLFQFPTERMINTILQGCFRRIDALESEDLIYHLAESNIEIAKMINLYAMMRQNAIVWDFMVTVIGEKYRTQNFEFNQSDLNLFYMRLSEQNDSIGSWSESTGQKIKQVLKKSLVECGYLDTNKSTKLNPVYAFDELVDGVKANGDFDALAAFNYFE